MEQKRDVSVLICVTAYSDKSFEHARSRYYQKNNIKVTVLSFADKRDAIVDNVQVISLKTFEKSKQKYDLLIMHAPNIRNHFWFLKKYGDIFPQFVFFFHGHEVMKKSIGYSEPYDYMKRGILKQKFNDLYDDFKLSVWRDYYSKVAYKSRFIFVSNWMREQFLHWTNIPERIIENRYSITYNCISEVFEKYEFDYKKNKQHDYLTIRANLDGSKYCVDLVNQLAKKYSHYRFLLVGKGEFFKHYDQAENLTWINDTLNHFQIVQLLEKAKCALMLTRTDAQGVMACEIASTGMPLITSDIPVCHEVFEGFDNVGFLKNDLHNENLDIIFHKLTDNVPYKKNKKYFNSYTSAQEIEIFRELIKE